MSEFVYPMAGSTAAGVLAITVAIWFLAMSILDKSNVRNRFVYTCQGLCIAYTAVSLVIIFVLSVAQDKGEIQTPETSLVHDHRMINQSHRVLYLGKSRAPNITQ